MTRQETVVIITLLAGNYESFSKRTQTDEQVKIIIDTWQECLCDLDYKLVLQAVKKTIIESPYPPTIAEIRKNAIEMINPTKDNALEDWNECYRMICNGTYMTQEEFDSHNEICRKFLGSLTQLRAYATNIDFNMDVVRSNFLKQYEVLKQKEKQDKLIPTKMKEMIEGLSNKLSLNEGE